MHKRSIFYIFVAVSLYAVVYMPVNAAGAEGFPIPSIELSFGNSGDDPGRVSMALQLLFIFTVLSLAPAILVMVTSFTRIVVVLSLLRHALGTQQIPANQIVIGLSLFLTFFIMMPVWNNVYEGGIQPYMNEEMEAGDALAAASRPVKQFMMTHTREKDLALFLKISKTEKPESPEAMGLAVLIPAFVISELKTAFQIGFMIYMPFLILDMVVASVLLSMGMLMLPPIMVSLPFKLLLFVLVDGWYLIVGSLVESFK